MAEVTPPLDLARLSELAEKATAEQVHPVNWSHWVRLVMMAGPARNFVEAMSPTTAKALLSEIATLRKVRDASEYVLRVRARQFEGYPIVLKDGRESYRGSHSRWLEDFYGALDELSAATEPAEREAAR